MMKQIALFTFVLLFGFQIHAQKQTRDLNAFHALDVSGGIAVELIKSESPKAEVTIIKGDMDDLMTEVSSGTLEIYFKRKAGYNWGGGEKARVILYTADLDAVETSAGAKVEGKETNLCNSLTVNASSGSSIALNVEAKQVNADASSGARISLDGSSGELDGDVSSGANINASLMKTQHVDAEASSGGKITVWSVESIKAGSSSGGAVKYKGDPTNTDIDKDKWSGGSVSKI